MIQQRMKRGGSRVRPGLVAIVAVMISMVDEGVGQCSVGQITSGPACVSCGIGYHVPSGATGDCTQYLCPQGSTDHDSRPDTPCITCGVGHFVPAGSSGSCFSLQCPVGTSDRDSNASTACERCHAGEFTGRASAGPCVLCSVGTSDVDRDPTTPCVPCGTGTFAPAGSQEPCTSLQCRVGTLDSDQNSSTPCTVCGGGGYVPQGQSNDRCSAYVCTGGSYDDDNSSATRCVYDIQCDGQTLQLPYIEDTTTAAPTSAGPTTTPSAAPSSSPTVPPPTAAPTVAPSNVAPTATPTAMPTSLAPTLAPTNRTDFCWRNCRAHYNSVAATSESSGGGVRYTYVTVAVGVVVAFVLGSIFGVLITMYCIRPAMSAAAQSAPVSQIKINPLHDQGIGVADMEMDPSASPILQDPVTMYLPTDETEYMKDPTPSSMYYPGSYGYDQYLNVAGAPHPGFAIPLDPSAMDDVVY